MHFLRDLAGIFLDRLQIILRDMSGRNDARGVAGVNTCQLDVLHDGRNISVRAVTDGVCLALHSVIEESVDQDRAVGRHTDSGEHVVLHGVIVIDNFHSASAQDVGRTDHDGIADGIGDRCRFFHSGGHS